MPQSIFTKINLRDGILFKHIDLFMDVPMNDQGDVITYDMIDIFFFTDRNQFQVSADWTSISYNFETKKNYFKISVFQDEEGCIFHEKCENLDQFAVKINKAIDFVYGYMEKHNYKLIDPPEEWKERWHRIKGTIPAFEKY